MLLHLGRKNKGFTLVEIMIVITIISLLSSIVLGALHSAQAHAQDSYRKQAMRQVRIALEAYYNDNGHYPYTSQCWMGLSANGALCGGTRTISGPNGYIPGLAPTYIPELPVDPRGDLSGWSGFLYLASYDGQEYKFLDHENGPEFFPSANAMFYDPVRPTWAWMLCVDDPNTPLNFCTDM